MTRIDLVSTLMLIAIPWVVIVVTLKLTHIL